MEGFSKITNFLLVDLKIYKGEKQQNALILYAYLLASASYKERGLLHE